MALPLAPFLLGLARPLVGRVLAALGFSVVVVAGVEASIGGLKNMVINAASTLPSDVFNLFIIAGGGVAMNIVLGAISFRLSLWVITRSVRMLGVNP